MLLNIEDLGIDSILVLLHLVDPRGVTQGSLPGLPISLEHVQ